MYDAISNCYMLISRSQKVPPANRPHLEYAAAGTPLIYILTRYQVLLRLLLSRLYSRLECSIQRRPSESSIGSKP